MLHVGAFLLKGVDGLVQAGPQPVHRPFLLSVHVVVQVKEDAVQKDNPEAKPYAQMVGDADHLSKLAV